jgi:hypothetical protein
MPLKNEFICGISSPRTIRVMTPVAEGFEKERIEWAIATAPYDPHLWQHKYKGTPLQILIESAKKLVD